MVLGAVIALVLLGIVVGGMTAIGVGESTSFLSGYIVVAGAAFLTRRAQPAVSIGLWAGLMIFFVLLLYLALNFSFPD
jgi:hypothetical protein